jgi:hypothetical protein
MTSVWPRTYQLSCNPTAIFSKDLAKEPQIPKDGYIRRMNLNHIELLRLFWGNHYCDSDWMFVPPADVVSDWLSDNNVRIWGYSHNDMLMATLMFRRLGEDPWTIMSVDCICVHRDVRGKGLTAMMLENLILQGSNMGWLRDNEAFTILGYRETPAGNLLHDLVPPLRKEKYIWTTGQASPIKKEERILHLNMKGTKVILFNTWRRTFPGGKEQWEVCWIEKNGGYLSALAEVCPNNIQIWVSSLYIDFDLESAEEKKGWTEAEGFLLLECWGRPLKKLQNMPYMHF